MYNLHDNKMKITLFFILHFILLIHLPAKSQQMNQIIDDPVRHRPVLIDQVDRSALLTGEIGQFFQDDYNSYQPDSSAINDLKQKTKNLHIQIVFGSWCGDSKEQLPRFLKILDEIGFDQKNLLMIGVDSHKKGRIADVSALTIEKVPTFIFFSDNKEIGRIIETPVNSLEKDFLQIVDKADSSEQNQH